MRSLNVNVSHWEANSTKVEVGNHVFYFNFEPCTRDLHLVGSVKALHALEDTHHAEIWENLIRSLKIVRKDILFHGLVWCRGDRQYRLSWTKVRKQMERRYVSRTR